MVILSMAFAVIAALSALACLVLVGYLLVGYLKQRFTAPQAFGGSVGALIAVGVNCISAMCFTRAAWSYYSFEWRPFNSGLALSALLTVCGYLFYWMDSKKRS